MGAKPLLEAALGYAERGWAVLPLWWPLPDGRCACERPNCPKPGKHPLGLLVPQGCNQATKDPTQIREWWHRFPQANGGIATGQLSGLHVLDVDPRHGGDETLRDLVAQHGPLPNTPEVITGSLGRHLYFEASNLPLGCPALCQGVDTRGKGGFVVAPPSLHASGHRYEWEVSSRPDDVPLAPMPQWIMEALGTKRDIPTPLFQGQRLPLGRAALDFVANGAPVGQQRSRAVAAARNYLSAGFAVDQTAAALWRGFQVSPVGEEERPWALQDAGEIACDIAARPAPQLRPFPAQHSSKRHFLPVVEVQL